MLLVKLLLILCIKIIIIYCDNKLPSIIKHPKSIILINETESLTIECEIDNQTKSNVTWYKNGIELTYNNGCQLISNSNLFIKSVNLDIDYGNYYCKAQNDYGYVYSNNATVIVTYLKDEFRAIPRNKKVNFGSNTILECKAPSGIPEPMIWWEKDGNKLNIDDKHYLLDNNSLEIKNITSYDSGQYICIAKNEAGIRRTRSALLNVYAEKPNFIRKPQSNKYLINSKIELICEAKGFPEPQIEWYKDNTNEVIKKGNVLIIENGKINDEGEYKCKALNNIGTIETKAKILIYEKPSFVKALPNYTIGFESKSLTLECNAKGYPKPVIYWAKSTSSDLSRNNQNPQDDYIILENGNLFIERLSKKYEGTYLCQANNEYGSIEMKTVLQIKQIQTKPPPIITYCPQNQTIAINTQAILECKTSGSDTKPIIIWYKGLQQITNQLYETRKYNLEESGSLVINSVQKSDSDTYKCIVTNSFGQTISPSATLKVEDPNDPNIEFRRNYDISALPLSCGKPTVLTITSNSIQLTWQPSNYIGRSRIISYRIEYFSPEWPRNSLGWIILVDDIPSHTNFYNVNNLQSDTYYLFIIRARNEQGYGAPSPVSDPVKTLFEPQLHFQEKNSNELLEKALSGEIIQLDEPDILSSTSLNITWRVLKSTYLIEGFIIKYKQTGTNDYRIEKLNDNKQRSIVINGLLKYTTYDIIVEPFSGMVHGSESNNIQAKTKEDVPESSPFNIFVEIESITSISIKWEPPPPNKTNGIIMGYKINCIANETKYNIYLNTNSTVRAIILENLIEGMKYCIKVAAYTKIGTGPFTQPFKCIEMIEKNLILKERTYIEKLNDIIFEPWFIATIIVFSLMAFIMLTFCFCYFIKRLKKRNKYSSSSSCSESTINLKKKTHGTRYKLVNDGVWIDTLHSSNHSNQECCCVPDLHHQLFVQNKDSFNTLHDVNLTLENRFQNTYRNTLIKKNDTNNQFNTTNKNNLKNNNSNNITSPQYAEIYSTNHYASTGLFNENTNNNFNYTNSSSSTNLDNNSNTNTNSTFVLNSNLNTEKKYKTILTANGKIINPILLKCQNGTNGEITEKEILKYLQSTQSQTNTPRIPIKCIQSIQRVKSLENQNRFLIDNNSNTLINTTDSIKTQKTQQTRNQDSIQSANSYHISQKHPPPPPRAPPPNLLNYLRENDLNQNILPLDNIISKFNEKLILNNDSTTALSHLYNTENIQNNQNYVVIEDNSQNEILNKFYQQFSNDQTNQIYKIISLTNDNSKTISNQSNTYNLNNLSSNVKNEIENENEIIQLNLWENPLKNDNSTTSNKNDSISILLPTNNSNNNNIENEYAIYLTTKQTIGEKD